MERYDHDQRKPGKLERNFPDTLYSYSLTK